MFNFGDTFYRIYGRTARHLVNILQGIQLLFTVSILILSNGQSISQISKGSICFVACLIIFMAAGMLVGQIRTLQRFGWLANFAVWINVLIIFIWYAVIPVEKRSLVIPLAWVSSPILLQISRQPRHPSEMRLDLVLFTDMPGLHQTEWRPVVMDLPDLLMA